MDNDEDLLGISKIQRRTLIQEIVSILQQYPDNSQILKEIIQNAEDASASQVIFIQDENNYHQPKAHYSTNGLSSYQGRSLICYNDALFTNNDWKGIVSLGISFKQKSPLKVGRFGLGFKSIFHLTDVPSIISGSYMAYIDPQRNLFEGQKEYKEVHFVQLNDYPYPDELKFLENLPKDIKNQFDGKRFKGTLFRFPIRDKPSEISQICCHNKVDQIKNTFCQEGTINMLFLKNVRKLSFYSIQGQTVEKIYELENLKSSGNQNAFTESLQKSVSLKQYSTMSYYEKLEFKESNFVSRTTNVLKYLISECFGNPSENSKFFDLIEDDDLKYIPLLGVAYPLQEEQINGHLFCCLPLPLSKMTLTGLPFHVNGFFALSQDRRDLKWATQFSGTKDKNIQWNEMLIESLLPIVCKNILEALIAVNEKLDIIYNFWPKKIQLDAKWLPFVEVVWSELCKTRCMFVPQEAKFLSSREVTVLDEKKLSKQLFKCFEKLFRQSNTRVITIPKEIFDIFVGYGQISSSDSAVIAAFQTTANLYQQSSKAEQNSMIKYTLSQDKLRKLQNFPLFRTTTGRYCTPRSPCFLLNENYPKSLLGGCGDVIDDGFYEKSTLKMIADAANKGWVNIKLLDTVQPMVRAIQECCQSYHFLPNMEWLNAVWNFCFKENLSIKHLENLPLVPIEKCGRMEFRKLQLNSRFILESMPNVPNIPIVLENFLQQLGIEFVSNKLPSFVTYMQESKNYFVFPDFNGIVYVLKDFDLSGYNFNPDLRKVFITLMQNVNVIPECLKNLKLFEDLAGKFVSINLCTIIKKHNIIPNWRPDKFVSTDRIPDNLKSKLYLQETTLTDAVRLFLSTAATISDDQNAFFLEKIASGLLPEDVLTQLKKFVFFKTNTGKSKLVKDLFQPATALNEFFFGENDKFPESKTANEFNALSVLKLKTIKDLTVKDIQESINSISNNHQSLTYKNLILKCVRIIDKANSLNINLNRFHEKWLPIQRKSGRDYPKSLVWRGNESETSFESIQNIYSSQSSALAGSLVFIIHHSLEEKLKPIHVKKPDLESVLQHLKTIEDCYKVDEIGLYREMIYEIYDYLKSQPASTVSMLWQRFGINVWNENAFVSTSKLVLRKLEVDLQPFYFECCENTLNRIATVLNKLCSIQLSNTDLCIDVLSKMNTSESTYGIQDLPFAVKLAKNIAGNIDHIHLSQKPNIYLPLESSDGSLKFAQLKDCYYHDFCENIETDSYNIISRFISFEVAEKLGVKNLVSEILSGDNDSLFEDWGQSEPLTLRINRLLKDYEDGLPIFKELIQNAEDAGATCVNFFYDARTHENFKTLLISQGLSEWQGPALYIHNDAMFTEQDFSNITKINAGTKSTNKSKIGQFGLGFNCVYNITDVPFILSGNNMLIFDPHKKYLGKAKQSSNHTGKRIRFDQQKNLSPFRHQFEIFNGVFDCHFDPKTCGVSFYQGSLFRLPLRKESTALTSEIKKLIYTEREMELLIKKLEEALEDILLFTENVVSISFKKMDQDGNVADLFNVNKTEQMVDTNMNSRNFLKQVSEIASTSSTCFVKTHSPQYQGKKITMIVNKYCITKSYEWLVNDFVCSNEAVQYAKQSDSIIPCGGLAFKLKPLEGSRDHSKFFCFLPLPMKTYLPVSVNGYFSLMNNRKQFEKVTTEIKYYMKEDWNEILAKELGIAYFNFLNHLKHKISKEPDNPHSLKSKFLAAFPVINNSVNERIVLLMIVSFVRQIVQNETAVYPCVWVSNCKEQILWNSWQSIAVVPDALQVISKEVCVVMNDESNLYNSSFILSQDEPIVQIVKKYEFDIYEVKQFKENMFYETFLKNASKWQQKDSDLFTRILLFLLKQHRNAGSLFELLCETPCIPTSKKGTLKQPKDLVKEGSSASKLFNIDDEVFPSPEFQEEFEYLIKLGMNAEVLSWEKIIERARYISSTNNCDQSKTLLDIMNKKLLLQTDDIPHSGYFKELSEIKFLPSLQKQQTSTQINWYANGNLVSATEAFLKKYTNIVSNSAAILDGEMNYKLESFLNLNKIPNENHVVSMFHEVRRIFDQHGCTKDVENIVDDLLQFMDDQGYKFLTKKIKDSALIYSEERDNIIAPCKMFFSLDKEVPNFLHKVPSNIHHKYYDLLSTLGTPNEPSIENYLAIVEAVHKENLSSCLSDAMMNILVHSIYPKIIELSRFQDDIITDIYVPDANGILQLASNLHYSDADWMNMDSPVVHPSISKAMAKDLGIEGLRKKHFDKNKISTFAFGQTIDLVVRIQGLLKGYTHTDFISELIQNADDAQATEMTFIIDHRQHGVKSILSDDWECLQGPSLITFNNGKFSETDLIAIQNVGAGSKKESCLKTGKYGVGFNSVYSITDCPTMIANVNEKHLFAIFDPFQQFTNGVKPGEGYNYEDVVDSYGDVIDAHCIKEIGFVPNTMFRLPLRVEGVKKNIKHISHVISIDQMERHIQKVMVDADKYLLFLKYVKGINFMFINKDGDIKSHVFHSKEMSENYDKEPENYFECFKNWFQHAHQYSRNICVTHTFDNQKCCSSHWEAVEQLGFSDPESEVVKMLKTSGEKDSLNLIPKGGVASKIYQECINSEKNFQSSKCCLMKEMKDILVTKSNYNVSCVLPIPENSGVPLLINANFALEYETRNSLWVKENDIEWHWNNAIIQKCIVPCYIRYILDHYQNSNTNCPETKIEKFFPSFKGKPYWKSLSEEFYFKIYNDDLPLMPVNYYVEKDICTTTYCCVKSEFLHYDFDTNHSSLSFLYGLFKKTEEPRLLKIFKSIGINVDNSSLVKNFEEVGCEITKVSPEVIGTKLKEMSNLITSKQGCCVKESKFKTVASVKAVLSYCCEKTKDQEEDCDLNGLPLCLLCDETLTVFSSTNSKFVSKFYDIFPVFTEKFIHSECVSSLEDYAQNDDCPCVKPLDLDAFTELLPEMIPERIYKGEIEEWKESSIVNIEWLRRLWNYIDKSIEENFALDKLNDWMFILATRGSKEYSLPVKKRKCVLYLDDDTDNITNLLKSIVFHVPVQSEAVYEPSVFSKFFGCHSNLEDLVESLLYSLEYENIKFSEDKANRILSHIDYLLFNKNPDRNLAKKLRRLPIFEALDGSFAALNDHNCMLIPERIPDAGVMEFGKVNNLILLKNSFSKNKAIVSFLELQKQDLMSFYQEFIFFLENSQFDDVLQHLKFLNQEISFFLNSNSNMWKRILSEARIIKCQDGSVKKCKELYDPKHDLFALLIKNEYLPCKELLEADLIHFLRNIGLIHTVNENNIIKCVKLIANEHDLTLAKKAFDILCQHDLKDIIERTVRNGNSSIIRSIICIPFIVPPNLESLNSICPSLNSRKSKITIEESVVYSKRFLVWTSMCVLPSNFPSFRFDKNSILDHKLIDKKNDKLKFETVVQNIKNVTETLKVGYRRSLKNIQKSEEDCWKRILTEFFEFLITAELSNDRIRKLSELSIIPVSGNKLNDSAHSVLASQSNFVNYPYINNVDVSYGKYFTLFENLGCSERATTAHFAQALNEIHDLSKQSEGKLNPKMVKEAGEKVIQLAECLKRGDTSLENMEKLYLLSVALYKDHSHELSLSTSIIFITDYSQESRFKNIDKHFLPNVYSRQSGKEINETLLKLLPKKLRPKYHYEVFEEKVLEKQIVELDDENNKLSIFKKHLHCNEFLHGLRRIFRDDNSKIQNFLKDYEIIVVNKIETLLYLEGKLIEDSAHEKLTFSRMTDSGISLYISIKCNEEKQISAQIARDIVRLLERNSVKPFENDYITLLSDVVLYLFSSPDDIETYLDTNFIPKDDSTNRSTGENFKLGELVPIAFHVLFDNDFVELEKDELVAIPQGEDDDEVYLYCKVIDCCEKNAENESLSTYKIQISENRDNIIELKGYQIFKFRSNWEKYETFGKEDDLETVTEEKQEASFESDEKPEIKEERLPSYEEAIKEIDKIVNDSRQLDEKARSKIHKRLYLKWHPDKHSEERKEFATKIFQYLKRRIENLDKDADEKFEQWSSHSHRYDNFDFEDIFRNCANFGQRNHQSRRNHHSRQYGWTPPFRPAKNPQPAEARRWLRQSKEDLYAATQSNVSEWKCFIAVKAAEKALKAAIYFDDYKITSETNLETLCYQVNNKTIQQFCIELRRLIQSEEHLVYPNKWSYPNIPHDMYDFEKSGKAINLAKIVIEEVEKIVQC